MTIEQVRKMQQKTFSVPTFCQMTLKQAGLTAKSVKTLPALIAYFRKHSTEATLLSAATTVYEQNTRAHTSFRKND